MKKIVLLSLFAFTFGGIMTKASAQIYMAAGQEKVNYVNFEEVKTLKLNSASEEKVLFTKNLLQPLRAKAENQNCGCDLSSPSFIAAMSLNTYGDILTMNMVGTQVYISRQNGSIQTINIENETRAFSEQALFARMGNTPDGSIYVLNNIGDQLIRITKNEQIEFLGKVEGFAEIFADNANKRASYGGDMIADTEGNLFVFTAFGMVVKVNPQTLSAEYLGQISGLPQGYTVNGVAVDDNNAIVLASSQGMGIYLTDINTLAASFAAENTTPVYDLASKNFLITQPTNLNPLANIVLSLAPTMVKRNGFFNIISNTEINNATVVIYGTDGKMAMKKMENLGAGINRIDVNNMLPGIYFVNILDMSGSKLLTDKITVE